MKKLGLILLALSPMSLMAQTAPTVDVSAATGAIAAAQTAGGTVITAGLAFCGIWVAYKYGRRIFGKA
jgi:Inovirus Coat protein B